MPDHLEDDFLEDMIKRMNGREDARLKLRGDRPHAPERGWLYAGMTVFSVSLAFVDEISTEIRVRALFQMKRPNNDVVMAWGEPWPDDGAEADAVVLLKALAVHWPEIAGPFFISPIGGGKVDLGAAAGLPKLLLSWTAKGELVVEADDGRTRPGPEQVIVVETLTALGRMLRDRVAAAGDDGAVVARLWDAALELTDLPPSPISNAAYDLIEPTDEAEAAWYAGKLGIDLATYRLNAISLHARQVIHAVEGSPAPTEEEWLPRGFAEGLDPNEVEALAAKAAIHVANGDVEAFKLQAINDANMTSRQIVIYGSKRLA